jgi:uncharacterized protein
VDNIPAQDRAAGRGSGYRRVNLFADYPEQPELAAAVRDCEHEGDRITHEILSRPAEYGTGLDPADVHALTGALDDIVDHAEEAADRVADSLRALRGGEDVAASLVEIHRLEDDADRIVRAAVASLFVNGIDPMIVIRWKDIFETLESAVDACETVANVLEGSRSSAVTAAISARARRRGARARRRSCSRRR